MFLDGPLALRVRARGPRGSTDFLVVQRLSAAAVPLSIDGTASLVRGYAAGIGAIASGSP